MLSSTTRYDRCCRAPHEMGRGEGALEAGKVYPRLTSSLTPIEFCALVEARASCVSAGDVRGASCAPPEASGMPQQPSCTLLKHAVKQYIDTYKKLPLKPRPCKHWLGSAWQRKLADVIIEKSEPTDDKQEGRDRDDAPKVHVRSVEAAVPAGIRSAGPSTDMSQAFMDQLKSRRRDELKKAQEKAEEERRENERIAHSNAKVMVIMSEAFAHVPRSPGSLTGCTVCRYSRPSGENSNI
jgi:hypothetical protein